MRVTLIGGMDRLEPHYIEEARKLGVKLKIFSSLAADLSGRIQNSEALVVFTSKVSHGARNRAVGIAKSRSIPVYQCHQCGVCALRKCLNGLCEAAMVDPLVVSSRSSRSQS